MDHFAVEISNAAWVITIYILLVAVLMPVFGHLGDMYGYKRIYMTGLSLLVLSSALAALAPSFPLLILFRGLQGIGNATTLPSVMAIITQVFPIRERGRAMGFWATVNGVGHARPRTCFGRLSHTIFRLASHLPAQRGYHPDWGAPHLAAGTPRL
jgi:MFS family permease